MRHRIAGKQLARNSSHRRAMLRNMVTSLFKHEQIETTDAKAKAIRPVAEKMITLAKRGDLHARRQALAYIKDKAVTHRLFDELKDRYLDRQGGYLRIIKKGTRKGDGAPISIVQLLPPEESKKSGGKKVKRTKTKKSQVDKPKKEQKDQKVKKEEKKAANKKNDKSSDVASKDAGVKDEKGSKAEQMDNESEA